MTREPERSRTEKLQPADARDAAAASDDGPTPQGRQGVPAEPRPRTGLRSPTGLRSATDREFPGWLWWGLPLLAFTVLVLLGITTSNIGVAALRADPGHPYGLQLGSSETIRSDEFMTESPLWLGQAAVGGGRIQTPLTVPPDFFAQLANGPVSTVVFFDGALLHLGDWVPTAMLFAFKWWLPTLLLVLAMPWWFREVTGSWRWGYLATVLTVFAPVTMWWSGRPINTLGFTFAGCALALHALRTAERRRWVWFVIEILASAILLARFPTYYQPLAIIVGIPVLVATAGVILFSAHLWRRRLIVVGAWGAATALVMGALIVEHLPEIRAGLDTVYPGRRTSTGAAAPFGWVFGAPELAFLKGLQEKLVAVNATEIGSSFTVLLGVLVILLVSRRWHPTRAAAVAFWVCGLTGLFWLSWCTLGWGGLGERIPLANLVPYFRAVNGVGVVAVIAFCILMAQWRSRSQLLGVLAGALTLGVSLLAGYDLMSETMPLLTRRMIWVSSFIAGALVYLLVSRPQSRWPLLATAVAVVSMTATVNPVLFGLADLRSSPTAQYFTAQSERARAAGEVWATDSIYTDALLLATGTPSLTTRQQIGPNAVEWQKLDPDLKYRDVWNRGGSYVTFVWSTDPGIEMSNPYPDVVLVKASPCTVLQRIPELRHVVSKQQLTGTCLQSAGTITWSGDTQYVYDLH